MPKIQILEAELTVVGICIFIFHVMYNKHIFTKIEPSCQLESKKETESNAYNEGIHDLIYELNNIKKMKCDFQSFQQSSILTYENILYYTSSSYNLNDIEQIHLNSNTPVHFTNSSLTFYISLQNQHTIFYHFDAELLSFLSHYLFSIFDFSLNDANIFSFTNSITSLKTIFLFFIFVFSLFLFFNKIYTFLTKSFHCCIYINANHNKIFLPLFIFCFLRMLMSYLKKQQEHSLFRIRVILQLQMHTKILRCML